MPVRDSWTMGRPWPTAKRAVVVGALAVLAVWVQAPQAARADGSGDDVAVEQLLNEDPRLSELVERDPALLETLRADPELARRLAVRPTLIEKAVETATNPWVLFGLAAQFLFMMRFVVQWIASERKKRSHVPVVFWYFSVGGGLMLLSYAVYRRDPVFILGQSLGLLIYVRNLALIYRRAWAYRELLAERAEAAANGGAAAVPVAVSSGTSPAS